MTTRKRRGRFVDGLFWQPGHGHQAPAEARDNPRARHCTHPPCHASPGEPCTVNTGRGRRRPMNGYHDARKEPAT